MGGTGFPELLLFYHHVVHLENVTPHILSWIISVIPVKEFKCDCRASVDKALSLLLQAAKHSRIHTINQIRANIIFEQIAVWPECCLTGRTLVSYSRLI